MSTNRNPFDLTDAERIDAAKSIHPIYNCPMRLVETIAALDDHYLGGMFESLFSPEIRITHIAGSKEMSLEIDRARLMIADELIERGLVDASEIMGGAAEWHTFRFEMIARLNGMEGASATRH